MWIYLTKLQRQGKPLVEKKLDLILFDYTYSSNPQSKPSSLLIITLPTLADISAPFLQFTLVLFWAVKPRANIHPLLISSSGRLHAGELQKS